MNTKKIESNDSIESLNNYKRVLLDFIKTKKDINELNKCLVVRGRRSVLIDMTISDYATDPGVVYTLHKSILDSETSEKSYHQVDFVFVTNFSVRGKLDKPMPNSIKTAGNNEAFSEKVREFIEENKSSIEESKGKILSFFVFSREGIMIEEYDVIEAVDKQGNVVDRVISPTPVVMRDLRPDPSEPSGFSRSAFVITDKILVNPFDDEVRKIFADANIKNTDIPNPINIDGFENDHKLYADRSDFIKERNKTLEDSLK